MTNSISIAHQSAETCDLDNWHTTSLLEEPKRLVRELFFRDPLKDCHFNLEAISIFGFYCEGDRSSLVYFWHKDLIEISPESGGSIESLHLMIEFGSDLQRLENKTPSLKSAFDLLGSQGLEQRIKMALDVERLELGWKQFDDLNFCCLYQVPAKGPVADYVIETCLCFHCDYFRYRSPVWGAVPIRYLVRHWGADLRSLSRIHLEPRSFLPYSNNNRIDSFRWPWQRCIGRGDRGLFFRPLRTCSIVFDIRKSTLAMQSVRDIGKFSPFIHDIVEEAREIVFSHGGFFDKETGDGVVAHFCSFLDTGDSEELGLPEKRAFDASVAIVRATSDLCEAFQIELDDWINDLGGAVGLHVGEAVWSAAGSSVQAIGSSVVSAARLCSAAHVHNVFVSNGFFQSVSKQLDGKTVAKFVRQEYETKEDNGRRHKSGFALNVRELF